MSGSGSCPRELPNQPRYSCSRDRLCFHFAALPAAPSLPKFSPNATRSRNRSSRSRTLSVDSVIDATSARVRSRSVRMARLMKNVRLRRGVPRSQSWSTRVPVSCLDPGRPLLRTSCPEPPPAPTCKGCFHLRVATDKITCTVHQVSPV